MISWFQNHMLPCAYKQLFGIDCPVCGLQRSLLAFVQGNFIESFKTYPPLIFVLALLCMCLAYLVFPSIIKPKYLRSYSALVLVIITINYVVKIADGNMYN